MKGNIFPKAALFRDFLERAPGHVTNEVGFFALYEVLMGQDRELRKEAFRCSLGDGSTVPFSAGSWRLLKGFVY